MYAVQECYKDFKRLAEKLAKRCKVSIPAEIVGGLLDGLLSDFPTRRKMNIDRFKAASPYTGN